MCPLSLSLIDCLLGAVPYEYLPFHGLRPSYSGPVIVGLCTRENVAFVSHFCGSCIALSQRCLFTSRLHLVGLTGFSAQGFKLVYTCAVHSGSTALSVQWLNAPINWHGKGGGGFNRNGLHKLHSPKRYSQGKTWAERAEKVRGFLLKYCL